LEWYSTEELRTIWRDNRREETFEAIRRIFVQRGENLPTQEVSPIQSAPPAGTRVADTQIDREMVERIRKDMQEKSTIDLVWLYHERDNPQHSMETIEAVRQLLIERCGILPEPPRVGSKALPSNPSAEQFLAYAMPYFEAKQYAKAEEFVDKAIQKKSDYREALFLNGVILDEIDKRVEAQEYYKKLRTTEMASLWRNLAGKLFNSDSERSILYYDRATNIDPSDSTTWHNMGNLYSKLGRRQEAKRCYQKILLWKEFKNRVLGALILTLAFGLIIMLLGSGVYLIKSFVPSSVVNTIRFIVRLIWFACIFYLLYEVRVWLRFSWKKL
jgi:tetratricopeptide (TPR) repeat protein